MRLLKFRIPATTPSAVAIVNFQVGPDLHAGGTEFELNEAQARKWVKKSDIEDGYVKFVGEVGADQPKYLDTVTSAYLDALAPAAGGGAALAQQHEMVAVGVQIPLTRMREAALTDVARVYPDFDANFEGIEFPDVDPTMLSVANYAVTAKIIPNGDGTASDLLEEGVGSTYAIGTRDQLPKHVGTLTSAGVHADQTTAAIAPRPAAAGCASGSVDLGLGASGAEWLYIGWYDRFDGVYFDIDTVNSAGATAAVEYAKITSSGTLAWTNVSNLTDGTANSTVTFASDGSMVWSRPGDWGTTVVASGFGEWYYVRVHSAGIALTAGADACITRIISRKIRGYDNDLFINAGDAVRFDVALDTTGGATQAATGATLMNATLWLSRVV